MKKRGSVRLDLGTEIYSIYTSTRGLYIKVKTDFELRSESVNGQTVGTILQIIRRVLTVD